MPIPIHASARSMVFKPHGTGLNTTSPLAIFRRGPTLSRTTPDTSVESPVAKSDDAVGRFFQSHTRLLMTPAVQSTPRRLEGCAKGSQSFHQLMPMATRSSTRHKLIWFLLSLLRWSLNLLRAGRFPSPMLLSSAGVWLFRKHSEGNMIMLMHIDQEHH